MATPTSESNQHTLSGEFVVEGVGLHEGQAAVLRAKPAAPNSGFVFVRVDLPGKPKIPADVDHVVQKERRTLLAYEEAEVHTCEHVLAGLYGIGVDNAEIELNGPEAPAIDGSAKAFADGALGVGLEQQDHERKWIGIASPLIANDRNASLSIAPSEGSFDIEYILDYQSSELPMQRAIHSWSPEAFVEEIAGARTFCLKSEADALQKAGFGKGASTQNTLVVGEDGVVDNDLRWDNEFARHKLLDFIGDIALSGCRIRGDVTCVRSGHALNQEMARQIRASYFAQMLGRRSSLPGSMDHVTILRDAPHRYPFLMIDRVVEVRNGGKHITGIKNVSFNEPFFQGHFPEKPVMPGVLQIEAMAQLAGITLRSRYPDTIGLLTGIERAKFRKEVFPGDQLRLDAKIVQERRGVVIAECKAQVDGELASSATIRFMLVPSDKV